MLTINAEILFTMPNQSYSGKKYPLRPTFNFGEGFLFSGTIISDDDEYQYGQIYSVDVEFKTVEGDVFAGIHHLVKIGMELNIQTGSRVIGVAKLLNFKYKDCFCSSIPTV